MELKKIANIISRNFWQMDGLTYLALSEPIKCKVYNWRNKKNMNIIGEDSMKFDYVIGNPPYQKNTGETANRQEPIYHFFMDSAYEIGEKVELITPARFLFNAGQTPVEWNKKMLNDENLKVLSYTANSKEVFPENDIKGGVAITYRDSTRNFGAIRTFIAYTELRTIRDKVRDIETEFISDYVIGQSNFNLDNLYKDYPNFKDRIHSGGRSKQIRSNAFEKFPEIFKDEESSKEMLKFYGIEKHNRTYKYIESKYIEPLANQDFYKVLIPQANGSGAIGEVLSTPVMGTPVMGTPVMGYTQSFIGLGVFKEEKECLNCLKYVKTKFARAMLGTLKITQNNAAPVIWSNVPMQDFTENSDIDWSVSISEIDKQLYKKYGLDEKEIAFIEEKVKEME